jgi:hypothetical protein
LLKDHIIPRALLPVVSLFTPGSIIYAKSRNNLKVVVLQNGGGPGKYRASGEIKQKRGKLSFIRDSFMLLLRVATFHML